MKTMILTLAAATALTAGAATAQPYGYYSRGDSFDRRLQMLDRRIDQGVRSGQLTRSEAYRARAQYNQLARLEARYRVNGLNGWERVDLDRRFDILATQVRMDRRDGDRRYGYNQYERYDDRLPY